MMLDEFLPVLHILDEIEAVSSTNKKQEIIAANASNELFRKVVRYALDPYLTFKMQSKLKFAGKLLSGKSCESIFAFLDQAAKKPALSKKEKDDFKNQMAGTSRATCEVVTRILNKDLRIKAGTLLFRKAHPLFADLPYHFPMKGHDDLSKFWKVARIRQNACWSWKLDGTRTWAVVSPEQIIYLSSNGHVLPNFGVFDDELRVAYNQLQDCSSIGSTIIFDGEVVNISGDFSRHMSQFRRLHNMDSSGFRFRIFDLVIDNLQFHQRYSLLSQSADLHAWEPYDEQQF